MTMYDQVVPTLAETRGDFIGPLNPHVGRFVRVRRHPRGPRLYLAGRRIHHGPAFGFAAILAWRLRWKRLAVALGAYAATDWQDAPFTDRQNH